MEKCPREDSFREMYAVIGDESAITSIRKSTPNKHHCAWLRRDSNACDSLPDGIEGGATGEPCPYNNYHNHPDVFERATGVADTIERLMRLVNSAEIGLLVPEGMSPMDITELITAKIELDRQDSVRREQAHAKPEAAANQTTGSVEDYFSQPENHR